MQNIYILTTIQQWDQNVYLPEKKLHIYHAL
jgi:hypothetical protein